MTQEEKQNPVKDGASDIEEQIGLKGKSQPKIFLVLRYVGWLFIAVIGNG